MGSGQKLEARKVQGHRPAMIKQSLLANRGTQPHTFASYIFQSLFAHSTTLTQQISSPFKYKQMFNCLGFNSLGAGYSLFSSGQISLPEAWVKVDLCIQAPLCFFICKEEQKAEFWVKALGFSQLNCSFVSRNILVNVYKHVYIHTWMISAVISTSHNTVFSSSVCCNYWILPKYLRTASSKPTSVFLRN